MFFIGIFLVNLLRCSLLLYEGIGRAILGDGSLIRVQTGYMILVDLPTLVLLSSFSLFIYYIS